ncbi:MAG: HD domain-containing protein [Thermoleophilia bacterium]|nr:HD domain-containing protein [Thermoleophilia bacterium]
MPDGHSRTEHTGNATDAGPQQVQLSEIVSALSHALDLTEGQPEGHAGRTSLLGIHIAGLLGVADEDVSSLYYALLLKDSGCSSSAVRMSRLFGTDDIELKRVGKLIDWTRASEVLPYVSRGVGVRNPLLRARKTLQVAMELARNDGLVDARCHRGAQIVAELGFPPAAAEVVRSLDEHWDGKGKPVGLCGEDIPRLARIACLCQTAEVFITSFGRDEARAMASKRRGRWFDPEVVDAFLAIPDDDPLWEQLEDAHDPNVVADSSPAPLLLPSDHSRLDHIAEAFAQVVDAKSAFTATHSRNVAAYAVTIARLMGYDARQLRDLRRAGLLHDIGKLGVSTAILDKPGRLTDAERDVIATHPRHTLEILSRVRAFEDIAPAAGAHHEKLDGTGYHRGLREDEIVRDARILAAADVFDALTADRPYRDGMPVDVALGIMRAEVGSALCPEAFAALEASLSGGMRLLR